MPAPNSNFAEIVATTLQGYSGKLADNITNHNALLRWLDKKGNKMPATGRSIVQELEYAENSTVQWFSGAETFSVAPGEVFSAAEFSYKQLVGSVVITGLEEIQNSGQEAVHNLLKSRIRNLEKSLKNTIATALYADGTGSDSKEIGGLQLLVPDTNTNTVGDISGSTYSWWRNYVYGFAANSATPGSSTIQAAMNKTWINTIRGSDKPDVILADSVYWLYYLASLQANQRFSDDKNAGAGFTNIVYMGEVPVIYDDQCPASHMYFLNTDYVYMRPAKGREYKPLANRASINQDAMVMPVTWAGNMTIANRSLQGVVIA
jgi:hypothetical protein